MNVEKIKNDAVEYAKKYVREETVEFDLKNKKYSVQEWYLVMTLAQIYYNLMQGHITRENAKEEQKKAFDLVKNHFDIFEDLDGEYCG